MTGATSNAGVALSRRSGPGILPPEAAGAGRPILPGAQVIGGAGTRPAGLALRFDPSPGDREDAFEIAVVDAQGRTLLPLGPFGEDEVVATWRRLGASSGLELMIARLDGSLDKPYPQIGRLQVGRVRIRRRHGGLGARRPRFLVRRKTGRLALRPQIHRGERELAGGPGA